MRSKRLADSGSIPCVDHKDEATQMSVIRRKTAASRLRLGLGAAAWLDWPAWSPRAANLRPLRLRRPRRRRPRCPRPPGCTSDETGGNVDVVDPETAQLVAHIAVGKRPRGIKISRDRTRLFVALSGSPIAGPGVDESKPPPGDRSADGIGVVDLATQKLLRVLPSGQDPEAFDVSLDGSTIYVSNEETSEMSMVDVATAAIKGKVPVGAEPEGVGVTPNGKEVWVMSEEDSALFVVDSAAGKMIAKMARRAVPAGSSSPPTARRRLRRTKRAARWACSTRSRTNR